MKKRIIGLCCAALIFCAGCAAGLGESGESSDLSEEGGDLSKSSLPFDDSFPEITPDTPTLTYLGSRDPNGSKALELYKKTFAADYTETDLLISEYCPENRLADALSERISADRSPDLTDKLPNSYPYLMSKNYYEDLTQYIDITAPQWENYSDYIEYYSYNGHHYFYPETVTAAPSFLVYDKDRFAMLGLEDPETLFYENKWTRSRFAGLAQKYFSFTGGMGLSGNNIADGFIASTGLPVFGKTEGNRLSCNLNDPAIENTLNYLSVELRSIAGEFFGYESFLLGESAFITANDEDFEALAENYPDARFGVVPFPRVDGSGKYYCAALCEGFLVPRSAENAKGAACFINCGRIAAEEAAAKQEESVLAKMRANGLIAVPGENYCFDSETNSAVENVLNSPFDGGEYSKEDEFAVINAAIAEINSLNE